MTTTRTTATRRFTLPFGDLLGQTLSIYFRNIVPFTVLGAVVMAPWAAVVLLIEPAKAARMPRSTEDVLEFLAMQGGVFLLQQLLSFLLTGAVVYGVVQQMRGQQSGMGLSLQMGLRNLGRSLGTGLLVSLRLLMFSLPSALVLLAASRVPGPFVMGVAFLVAFGLLVPVVMEFIRLYVALPAAVMEERGGGPAIARSKGLTDGSRWPIFGAVVVMGMATGMVSAMVLVPVALMLDNPEGLLPLVLTIALTVVSQGLAATMMAVTYFLLRRGKENADPATLASVFD